MKYKQTDIYGNENELNFFTKRYFCCICHRELKAKPIRLVKQEYGAGKYNQYAHVCNYDFCKRCYTVFNNWIEKHSEK